VKNSKTSDQKEVQPQGQLNKYSDVMEETRLIFGLKNPPTKGQPTKEPQTKRDNTIGVTFLKRSKNQIYNFHKMTNSLNSQKKEGLETKQTESQTKLEVNKSAESQTRVEVEDPSQIAQYLTEDQMGVFLQALMDQKQQEESANKKPLTADQIEELESYPNYWRATLREAAERGESIKETYEELKDLDNLT